MTMTRIARVLLGAGLVLSVLPSATWAGHRCETEPPMFTTAGSQDVLGPTSFVVAAQDKAFGCPQERLTITAAGLERVPVRTFIDNRTLGEASVTIDLTGGPVPQGTYHVTYTVTDPYSNAVAVSLPLRVGVSANSTPVLDPISNLVVFVGQTASFTIGVSDQDADLLISSQTLVIDGLPAHAKVSYTRVTADRITARIRLTPTSSDLGTYRVHIRGQDGHGGFAIAQMRILIE